jgi:hypothetical protein
MSCALAGDNKASYKHNQGGKYGDIHQQKPSNIWLSNDAAGKSKTYRTVRIRRSGKSDIVAAKHQNNARFQMSRKCKVSAVGGGRA